MRRNLINFLFLLVLLFYCSYLISRVILEKIPQNPIFIIGFFLFFAFLIKGGTALVNFFLKNKEKYLRKSEDSPDGFFRRKALVLANIFNKIEYFILITFLRKFLGKNKLISLFFFYCVSFYEKLVEKNKFRLCFIWFLIILPWIFSNTIFLIEILITKSLYYTLYCLSLNFLVFRFFRFWKVIVKDTLHLMSTLTLLTYLPTIFKDLKALNFYINNAAIRKNVSVGPIEKKYEGFSETIRGGSPGYYRVMDKELQKEIINRNRNKSLVQEISNSKIGRPYNADRDLID